MLWKMASSNCSLSFSSLLCQETEVCLGEEEEEEEEQSFLFVNDVDPSETEDDYIDMLVSREISFTAENDGCLDDCMTENWLKSACLDAVQWILKMRKFFGFSFQTAYLSVTYLHRCLSRFQVDNRKSWAIRLLSVACLSLAAKMEECKIPALSEFCTEEYYFESKVIQRMELLVLNTLEWRMNSVTPFAYLNYFITKFSNESNPQALLPKAIKIILDTAEVMNLMNYRPSAIAAAAVMVSSDERLTNQPMDINMGIISSGRCLENDHVFTCYNLMMEIEKRKINLPNPVNHPNISSIYASSVVLDAASVTSVGSKRRRLATKEYNQDDHASDDK